ncbi:MAG TPA: acyltransferase [Chitinophagaceae bacterium]|nr:acyltransferase [Chitinophagaceae bacterium]
MKQIKQLDALRGIAVVLVVGFHWLPDNILNSTYPNRPFDVDFFFVLSGFLITSILFISRNKAEELDIPITLVYKNFFIRRALRIFPAYFLTVFLIILFHITHIIPSTIKQELLPSITYTMNFYLYYTKVWADMTSHFWTLAVEEQYYLFWPWVILLINRKYLLHAILIFISIGFISQTLITDMDFGYMPTYTCFDAFGIGAFISWIALYHPQHVRKMFLVFQVLAIISLVIFFTVILVDHNYFIHQQRFLRSIMGGCVISYIVYKGESKKMNFSFIFNSRALIFLGKISYGMYLYHVFLPWDSPLLDKLFNQFLPASALRHIDSIIVIENLILLVLFSWLSLKLYEEPINNLKRYFRYKKGELVQLKKSNPTPV